MTAMPGPRSRFRLGFSVHHQSVWLSELLANIAIVLLLVLLMSTTVGIFLNARAIHQRDRRIAALKSEKIATDYRRAALEQEARLLTLLRTLAGTRVADSTLAVVAKLVCSNSEQFGYDPLLLVAVIQVEGVFDPHAQGRFRSGAPSGAIGLMQLQYETARETARLLKMPDITAADLLKPQTNLLLGAAYLTRLITQFKNFRLGLIAYNQGPGSVIQTLSDREPLSNEYYQMVLRSYFLLKKLSEKL
jgi:soluble lytic murein transglycosylase-like protein